MGEAKGPWAPRSGARIVSEPRSLTAFWQWCCIAAALGLPLYWLSAMMASRGEKVRFVWVGNESVFAEKLAPTLEGAAARLQQMQTSDGSQVVKVIEMARSTHYAWLLHVASRAAGPKVLSWKQYQSSVEYLDPVKASDAVYFFERFSANPPSGARR